MFVIDFTPLSSANTVKNTIVIRLIFVTDTFVRSQKIIIIINTDWNIIANHVAPVIAFFCPYFCAYLIPI